ncbi:PTS glucose transporter subunit IIA [Candidatus Merdisoma sp. JLR.KK006]|uniref:PTS sugar transporter subunit IIA n=1 Tax=Candidatus Merdisoma sp. JLR.KK006 TaxID=3112626 RepID=UPI002FF01D94
MRLFSRRKKEEFVSPMKGTLLPLEQVPDPVFSERVMGDGFAVELSGSEVFAPVSGTVVTAFPTGHAFGIKTNDEMELLIHIGIDTVNLNGTGFEVQVREGDTVKQGDVLVRVDVNYVKEQGKSIVSPVIFTSGEKIELLKSGIVQNGECGIITIKAPVSP